MTNCAARWETNTISCVQTVLEHFRRVDLSGNGNVTTQGARVRTPECTEAVAEAVSNSKHVR
jgi:hypothetical protein